MKAYKKSLTKNRVASIRKKLGLSLGRKIMSREQGILKFKVVNIIGRYFLFHYRYWRRIRSREQGMLKFEVGNIIVQDFLFRGRYGILNHGDTKAQSHRENRVSMIGMIPGKSSIRNMFFLFMELCSEKINMMMWKNPHATGGCYKWTREKWLNLTEAHILSNKENAIQIAWWKKPEQSAITNLYLRHNMQRCLRHQISYGNQKLSCIGIPCK